MPIKHIKNLSPPAQRPPLSLLERQQGGMEGLLIGDALGVPFEFKPSTQIPEIEKIDFVLPPNYPRSHPGVPIGTWSDDGAMALCLAHQLHTNSMVYPPALGDLFIKWRKTGFATPDGKVFDIGNTTRSALASISRGTHAEEAGLTSEDSQGNGSLMRCLPIALYYANNPSLTAIVKEARRQSLVTHRHSVPQVACAVYAVWAWHELRGEQLDLSEAIDRTAPHIFDTPGQTGLTTIMAYVSHNQTVANGTGFVIDSLYSADWALAKSHDFTQAIQISIKLGNDTDTTAAITGGLAGIRYGLPGLPQRWRQMLLGRPVFHALAGQWCAALAR